MTEYTISGRWKTPDGWQEFETTVDAPNENVARERTYAEFGSRHRLKRPQIDISGVNQ